MRDPWRGLVETEPSHTMFTALPRICDLESDIGFAQRKDTTMETKKSWHKKMTKSLNKIIDKRSVPAEHHADLFNCLEMVRDRTPLACDWNLAMYKSFSNLSLAPDPFAADADPLNPAADAEAPNPVAHALNPAPVAGADDVELDASDDQNDPPPDPEDDEAYAPVEYMVGQFVVVRPADGEDDTFNLAQTKSATATNANGDEWLWVMWYTRERKHADPLKDHYGPEKVKGKGCNGYGWQKVWLASLGGTTNLTKLKNGSHYKLDSAEQTKVKAVATAFALISAELSDDEVEDGDDAGDGSNSADDSDDNQPLGYK